LFLSEKKRGGIVSQNFENRCVLLQRNSPAEKCSGLVFLAAIWG